MGYTSILLTPGIDVEKTPVLNSAGWSVSENVRFFEGLPQKIGGWTTLNSMTPASDYVRGMYSWADNDGIAYIALGTANSLELYLGGFLYDITPLRDTVNIAPAFSTTNGSPTVTVTDAAHGAISGDRVNIVVPVSVGGLILQGFYTVTFVDANNYTITADANATATVAAGGAVPSFTTAAASANVTVTLNDHGLTTADLFVVQVSTSVSTLTIEGVYSISSITNANQFVIDGGALAAGIATVSENSGNARIQYLIPSGINSATVSSTGGAYGAGIYGAGIYSPLTAGSYTIQLRYWALSNFGQDLVASYNGGPIYIWEPPYTQYSLTNQAVELNTTNFPGAQDPPEVTLWTFASTTQQQIIALGCNTAGTSDFDPLNVRWCDVGDFTDWTATSTNLAGSFRIPSGSTLITGIATANFNVIWTDVDMWLMSWLGAPYAWSFQKVADAVDCIGPLACGVYRNMVFWAHSNGFYYFDGSSVKQIPCPVWDQFWFNLDRQQAYKINIQINSFFGDISWGYPSASGTGEIDSRVTFNINNNTWTFDSIARTDWIDESPYGAPIGADTSFLLQQHETSNDAGSAPLPASITSGWFTLTEGDPQTFIERMAADLIVTGGGQQVQITIYMKDWPTSPVRTLGPFTYTADGSTGPPYSIVRGRGRLAQIKIASSGIGVFWRLGRIRLMLAQAGKGN